MEKAFNVVLALVGLNEEKMESIILARKLIPIDSLRRMARDEQVELWNLPLSALQRKIGEKGRFCLPDRSVIDNPLEFPLWQYSDYNPLDSSKGSRFLPQQMVYYVKLDSSEGKEGTPSSVPTAGRVPIQEKDWDHVFQANGILNCSMIENGRFIMAPFPAFRLRDAADDDAVPPMPLDDDRAKIPVWRLSPQAGRARIVHTEFEIQQSAVESANSEESWNIGLKGSYKEVEGEGKYERTTKSSSKDSQSYGKQQNRTNMIYEVPIAEISLRPWNVRLSDICRQALRRLRILKNFDDLMAFFNHYGTVYANRIVLGGRLLSTEEFQKDSISNTVERESSFSQDASLSLGIMSFGISGGYSSKQGFSSSYEFKKDVSQKQIDWRSYGGNPAFTSKPDQWFDSLNDYRYWEIVENADTEAIQDFIGRLPGYDDIPGLFDTILRTGLYDQNALRLCNGGLPTLEPPKTEPTRNIGDGVNALNGNSTTDSPFKTRFPDGATAPSTSTIQGGVSWQVLSSRSDLKNEVESLVRTVTNTGTNYNIVPAQLYYLSAASRTINIVMEWSGDTHSYGLYEEMGQNALAIQAENLRKAYPTAAEPLEAANKGMSLVDSTQINNGKRLILPKDSDWTTKADEVSNKMKELSAALPQSSPLQSWMATSMVVWNMARLDVEKHYTDAIKAGEDGKPKTLNARQLQIEGNVVSMMADAINKILYENPGEAGTVYQPYEMADDAYNLLNQSAPKGAEAFMNKYGHRFIHNYSETPKLAAVWRINLPRDIAPIEVERWRLYIGSYFARPRSIVEVCESFEEIAHDESGKIDIRASIYGFRDPVSKELVDLKDIGTTETKSYLTADALARNIVRSFYGLREYKELKVNYNGKPLDGLPLQSYQAIKSVSPDPQLVLGLEGLKWRLFILKAYEYGQATSDKLKGFFTQLNELRDAKSMDADGKITPAAAKALKDLLDKVDEEIKDKENPQTPRHLVS